MGLFNILGHERTRRAIIEKADLATAAEANDRHLATQIDVVRADMLAHWRAHEQRDQELAQWQEAVQEQLSAMTERIDGIDMRQNGVNNESAIQIRRDLNILSQKVGEDLARHGKRIGDVEHHMPKLRNDIARSDSFHGQTQSWYRDLSSRVRKLEDMLNPDKGESAPQDLIERAKAAHGGVWVASRTEAERLRREMALDVIEEAQQLLNEWLNDASSGRLRERTEAWIDARMS